MRRLSTIAFTLVAFGTASAVMAAEIPRQTWLRAKCALCHGEDGSGNTPEGKKRNVPDLRKEAIQNLSDAELTKIIADGHGKMPAFKGLSDQQVRAIVIYIRGLAKK